MEKQIHRSPGGQTLRRVASFVSTVRYIWAINSSGQQIWVYDNPQHVLPGGVAPGGLRAASFGTW